ncbi:MAG: prolyl oligopeptidase family serine peptidase [Planctomycetes bacterium]|nr:prolyl oligopeptidase family serine peptidase [Planctomycetota bacterium]MCH9724530.1 prolyl oligopeptidase family serine peptidase [Planctomycetota bacterium]MCH9776172.1 prolyl oligopeptidase family serine peptidase [Planctomycetota bacterium]MCH9791371.1 prolyl oligopeptidase family serine peptidase [Planctomycetota bacterium]
MANTHSITCPNCTASFKIKNAAAFGKKVKCPKCDEPFVIPKPKKKKQQIKPELEFLDDDSDSYADPLEDEFADWDANLSGGPSAKPKASKKKTSPPKKKRAKSSFSLKDYGFSPFITGTSVFLILLNLILFFMQSRFLMLAFFLSFLLGIGCLFAGGIGLLIEAAKESGGELALCLVIPFYNLYFGISRFDQTKHSVATFVTGVSLMVFSFLLFYGSVSNIFPGRNRNFAHTPLPTNTAPDDNRNTNSTSENNRIANRFNSNPQSRTPSRTQSNFPPQKSAQNTESKLTQLAKFDLSRTKPMLMAWPTEGVEGLNVYQKQSTKSIGKVFEVSNSRSFDGDAPAGAKMKFRVYLPPDIDPASPVPCILVPPAGSNLLTGMEIDSYDLSPNPEHEPYVKAGFAVITFSLDGPLLGREQASNQEVKMAHKDFKKSKAGLVNCVHAFLETQAIIPGIDKNNVFIAGHSSAGTLSLLFAEHYPQIKGCLAYAPSVDLKKSMADFLPQIKPLIPDIEDFLRLSSPQTHIKDLKCPVFLFHSRGDQVTSFQNSYQFASQLTAQGTDVEFVAGNGSDHYQTMIDEGLPKGIEWLKKQVTKPNSSQPAPQMAAVSGADTKKTSKTSPQTPNDSIDITRKKATFKVKGFDDFYTNAIKGNDEFWIKSLVEKARLGLQDIVPGYAKGADQLDVAKMTFSFEFVGSLPEGLPQKFANHFFAKSMTLSDEAPTIEVVSTNTNSRIMDSNFLTFRIRQLNRVRFNKNTTPKIAEANLRQINRYVPDSLIINFDAKWIYIKLNGLENKRQFESPAISAFFKAGIIVTPEKINLTPADLAMNGSTNPANAGTTTNPASTTKQKYIIRYGVYGGKKAKEAAIRSLKGFVWVDQKSIQINPDAKEISFINRSPVDQSALNRALTRNKFYQLNITQESVPETKTEPEKEEAKTGT